ncbi:MAG: sulfatase-like hydrolase/transferase, partial [Draconibacterium sp.]|nr:sulfatase-like hydrolase/transferase [Draconibacterium sp.]
MIQHLLITRLIGIVNLIVISALFLINPIRANDKENLPNIVIILADDLGYGDVACYNPESKIPTPNLDKLASEGMKFTDAHSASTVCTPSRYSILTGRMAFRTGMKGVFAGVK